MTAQVQDSAEPLVSARHPPSTPWPSCAEQARWDRAPFPVTTQGPCLPLRPQVTEVFSQTRNGEHVRITITLTNELPPTSPTCLQFYNIIFRRSVSTLQHLSKKRCERTDELNAVSSVSRWSVRHRVTVCHCLRRGH